MYLVDASVFLEVELDQEKSSDCERFLRRVETGEIKALVPDFGIDSIALVMESRNKTWKDIRKFLISLALFRGLTIYHVTHKDKVQATGHMKNFKLDFDDSITLQSAVSNGIRAIVTLDGDFARIKTIQRLEPKDA